MTVRLEFDLDEGLPPLPGHVAGSAGIAKDQYRQSRADHSPRCRLIYSTGHAVQLCRKAASLAATSARNMGCRSIDGEYLLAGTSRPRASAMART